MFFYMREDTMMLQHPSCVSIQLRPVAIQVRPVELQVNTETMLICISRHDPKCHATSNAVVEIQVITVEIQIVFIKIQVKFTLFFNKFNMYLQSSDVSRQH